MKATTRISGTVFEVAMADRLTFNDRGAFRTLLDEITAAKPTKCVIDLSAVSSINSAALGMLMIAVERGKNDGWSLTLRAPQSQVKSVLELGKFDKLVTVVS